MQHTRIHKGNKEMVKGVIKLGERLKRKYGMISMLLDYMDLIEAIVPEASKEEIKRWYDKNRHEIEEIGEIKTWDKIGDGIIRGEVGSDWKKIWISRVKRGCRGIVIYEGIFIGEGKIPQLHVEIEDESKIEEREREVGENYFIVHALEKLTGEVDEEEFDREVVGLIKRNRSEIGKIRGLSDSGKIEYIGSGSFGVVYRLNDRMVLKIFMGNFDREGAKESMELIWGGERRGRTEAMVYGEGSFGEFMGEEVRYYIMEKMKGIEEIKDKTVGSSILEIVRVVRGICEQEIMRKWGYKKGRDIGWGEVEGWIMGRVEKIEGEIRRTAYWEVKKIEGSGELWEGWLREFIEEYMMKYMSGREDLHDGNVGITRGRSLRYYDS
jgi:hypothetical protein